MKIHNLLVALAVSTFTIAALLPWMVVAQEVTDHTNHNEALTLVTAKQAAAKITVKIGVGQGGGSGVLLAKKGSTYLVLTSAVQRQARVEVTTPDGQMHVAQRVQNAQMGDFDLALFEFNSVQAYDLAKFANFEDRGAVLNEGREVFAAGFPYDSNGLRLLESKVTQLPQEAFKNGMQVGYVTQGDLVQGMSGGPVLDSWGNLVGINSTLVRPLVDSYVYADGSKAPGDKVAEYRQTNWSVPMYNLLTRLNPDVLHSYQQLPKLPPIVTLTGYMAELDRKARSVTVRIEYSNGENGSGVIVAKKGDVYYVLVANHIIRNKDNKIRNNLRLVAPDQKTYDVISSEISPSIGVDLAIIKFTSSKAYEIAKLGNYDLRGGYYIFSAGWPSRERINSQQWQWQINPGSLQGQKGRGDADFRLNDYSYFNSGYDIIHSSITYAGMSGGPIFDVDGQVIGIHGKTEGDKFLGNSLRNSLGISVRSFLRSANQLGINLSDLNISTVFPRKLTSTDLISLIKVMWNITVPGENASADQWIEYGTQLFRTERFPEAVKAFEQAIIRKPDSINAYVGKSLTFPNMNRNYPAALEATNQAIELVPLIDQPRFYYLWKIRSTALKKLKRYEEALVAINDAIKLDQQDIISLYDKGFLLNILKRYPEAITVYNQIIAKEKKHSWAYFGRGEVKNLMGDYEGAMADLDIAINIDPENANSYSYRGFMKVSRKNNKAAIADLDIAINIDPENAKAHVIRGTAKFSQAMIELLEEGTSADNSFKSHQNQTKYDREISLVRKKFKLRLIEARKDIVDAARFYVVENNQEGYELAVNVLKTWPE